MADFRSPGIKVTVVDNSQYTAPSIGAPYSTATMGATLGGELYVPRFLYSFDEFEQIYGAPRHTSAYYSYLSISAAPVLMTRVAAIYPGFDFAGNDPGANAPSTAQESLVAYFKAQGYDASSMTYDDVIRDRTYYGVLGFKANIGFAIAEVAGNSDTTVVVPNNTDGLFFTDDTKQFFVYRKYNGAEWEKWQPIEGVLDGTDTLIVDSDDGIKFEYDSTNGIKLVNDYDNYIQVAYLIHFRDTYTAIVPTNSQIPYIGTTIVFESKYPGKVGEKIDIMFTPVTYGVRTDGERYLREASCKVYKDNVAVEDFGIVSFDPADSNFFAPIIKQSAYINNVYYTINNDLTDLHDDFDSEFSTYDVKELIIPNSLVTNYSSTNTGSGDINFTDLDYAFYGVRDFSHGFADLGAGIEAQFDSTSYCYTEYTYLPPVNTDAVNYAISDTVTKDLYANLNVLSTVTIDNPDDIFQGASADGEFYAITAGTITVSQSDLNELFIGAVDYVLRDILTDETYVYTLVTAPFDDDSSTLPIFSALKYNAEYKLSAFFIYDMNKNEVLSRNSAIDYHNRLDSTWHGAIVWDYGYVYNKFIGRKILMYPSIELVHDIMYSATNYRIWYAPAGQKRGTAGPLIELRNNPKKKDRDELYGYPNRINPLVNVPGFGIMLYGQKTLQTVTSKLDRINVAMLIKYLVRRINEVLPPMLFEFNDAVFESRINDLMTPIFEELYYNRGVEEMPFIDFKTTAFDAAQKKAVLVIHIKPRDVVEYIDVTISVDSAAVTEVNVQ